MIGKAAARALALGVAMLLGGTAAAQGATAQGTTAAPSIVFVGNSFTYGANSPVWKYRAGTVTDLNNQGVGGVPALFKVFTQQAGLDYAVSLETQGGSDFAWHMREKSAVLDRHWDHVILQGYSTLDQANPGNPATIMRDAPLFAAMMHARNPNVDVRLTATWSRADQVYTPTGHWRGKPVETMAKDLRRAYEMAKLGSPQIRGVIPVGDAWNRAFATGFADTNPYDGIEADKVNLWTWDNYHASSFGYYIEALMVFGAITGKDPLSLGRNELAAQELGISPAQAVAMQQLAHDELAAQAAGRP